MPCVSSTFLMWKTRLEGTQDPALRQAPKSGSGPRRWGAVEIGALHLHLRFWSNKKPVQAGLEKKRADQHNVQRVLSL